MEIPDVQGWGKLCDIVIGTYGPLSRIAAECIAFKASYDDRL
jgi:hypothetical protein